MKLIKTRTRPTYIELRSIFQEETLWDDNQADIIDTIEHLKIIIEELNGYLLITKQQEDK